MRIYTLVTFLFVCLSVFSQEELAIRATIVDANSGKPVEYVNIGFEGKGIGTVSASNGSFFLKLNNTLISLETDLVVSSIGYVTERIPFNEWKDWGEPGKYILLQPETTTLDPVVIVAGKREYERLGSETYSLSELGYWTEKDALGGELASRIRIDNERTRLHDLKFHVIRNEADSIKLRINIYRCENNMPGENILRTNIYHTIRKTKGIEIIPLKQHNIVVDNDIVVGIEMIESYGEELYLSVSATPFGGTAYLRERSQSNWDVRWNFGLAFGLLSSYPIAPSNP